MKKNDIRFAEILDKMEEVALKKEWYEAIPLIKYEGQTLNRVWNEATSRALRMYTDLLDQVWSEHVIRAHRTNELTA